MIKTKLPILFVSFFLLLGGFNDSPHNSFQTAFPSKDFLNMEGLTVSHVIKNSQDSLSDNKIVELQDKSGLTIWFGRYFYKDICITGICRMVKLWIFWDGVGNYLGMQLDEKEPLTKSDHTPFEKQDYVRLDEILADTVSILKELQYEDLVIEDKSDISIDDKSKKSLFEVDGYSSATLPSLKEYVVKDAVFTCYTLWHTVYGETKADIDNLLHGRIDSQYLNKLLNGGDNQKLFALEMIRQNNSFFPEFESRLLSLITSQNKSISEKALSLITPQYLNNPQNQLKFIGLMDDSRSEIKYEIIYKMQSLSNVPPEAIVLLLDKFSTGKISVGGLNQIYRIISRQLITEKTLLQNNEISNRLSELSAHPDAYTSNLTKNFLKSIK